jgi:hypothetical protein
MELMEFDCGLERSLLCTKEFERWMKVSKYNQMQVYVYIDPSAFLLEALLFDGDQNKMK